MAEKRVSVRLAASGGRQVKAELEGVGEGGARSFRTLSREADDLNRRLAAFARRAAVAATAVGTAAVAAGAAMIRNGLQTIDAQAKLAQSLDTTVESVQVLQRAGDLAGLSVGELGQATQQLTRRLSQAAAGTGPAVEALGRLNLTAAELQQIPLDQRVALIQDRLAALVPEAERAAVAAQLFGDRAGLVFTRIDGATLRTASDDIRRFGVAVSEVQADQIERTNDALSRLALVGQGVTNQLTAGAAPAIERIADGLAAFSQKGTVANDVMTALAGNVDKIALAVGALATLLAGRLTASAITATAAMVGLTGPIGIAVALLGLAGAAFVTFREGAGTTAPPVDEARTALALLNEVMGTFSSSAAPSAQAAALNAATTYRDQAAAAIQAAEAELALLEAKQATARELFSENPLTRDGSGYETEMARQAAGLRAEIESLRGSLDMAKVRIRQAATEITSQMGPAMLESSEATQTLTLELNGLDRILAKLGGAGGGSGGGAVDDVAESVVILGLRMDQVRDQMAGAFASIVTGADSAREAIGTLLASFANTMAQSAFNSLFATLPIPGFASGTNFAPGGLAVVGERGPELVTLPRGAQVIPAGRTRDMLGGGGTVRIVIEEAPGFASRVRTEAEGVAVQVTRAGLGAYDRSLPDRVQQIARDPRRRA